MKKNAFSLYEQILIFFDPKIQQLEYNSFQRPFLIQTSGLDGIFRIKTDVYSAFYLAVAPTGSLADILINSKRRDAEGRTDLSGRSFLELHDFDMLQEAKLTKQHGQHIHPVCTGQQLIAHQQESPAALAGDYGINHLKDSAFGGRGGDCAN